MGRVLCTIMDRVSIDLKYKGGSVRMAAASATIDRGVPLDVVLDTGRWVRRCGGQGAGLAARRRGRATADRTL